jgi:poly-gamma-glutamate synthesis protein (capsule biosynthesis protein)
MKRFTAVFIVVGIFFLFGVYITAKSPAVVATQKITESYPKHFAFYAHKEDYGNVEQKNYHQRINEKIYGGIVSHHLLAGEDIGAFFAELRDQKIKTVVIVGPNHYGVGKGGVLTSLYPYNTPWGTVSPDTAIATKLIERGVVSVDEMPFTKEHAISALVSYVAYHLPDARMVPIIIRSNTDREHLDRLAKSLSEVLPQDAVVIASVDFSHHLNRTAALFHDDMTISAIENFDYERVQKAAVDSLQSLYVLMRYLESQEAQHVDYKRVNAADLMGNPSYNDVTSYLFAHFTKGVPLHSHTVTTLNFGDMMFDRGVRGFIEKDGDPFLHIRGVEDHFLKGIDVVLGNLEGPITQQTKCQQKPYSFRFDPDIATMLRREGFNALNLANNHSNDCYREGFMDTRQYLSNASVAPFGSHHINESYTIKKIGATNVAFIGIDETASSDADLDVFYEKIIELKKANEHIVVHIHWGFEYDTMPSSRQTAVGHKLIDSGADVVIGHHPHVVQPIEIYNGRAIFYSLGNFIFDQIAKETKIGVAVGTVYREGQMSFYLFPYTIIRFQPTLMPYREMKEFCDKILTGLPSTDTCYFKL